MTPTSHHTQMPRCLEDVLLDENIEYLDDRGGA